jgi:hypothetical protein
MHHTGGPLAKSSEGSNKTASLFFSSGVMPTGTALFLRRRALDSLEGDAAPGFT